MEILLKKNPQMRRIKIFVAGKTQSIRKSLWECKLKGIEITVAWIPGHSGIPGNESADWGAKSAMRISSESHDLVYSHDLSLLAKSKLMFAWEKSWASTRFQKGKFYSNIQNDIPVKPWFFKYKDISKNVTSCISRLRLGHACTPTHLAKIRVHKMESCDFVGSQILEKKIVNRKIFNDKSKVNWLKTKEILITKKTQHSLFMRTSFNEDYKELNIKKKLKGVDLGVIEEDLQELWPSGKLINKKKLNDLKSLFHLIPNDCIGYYKKLKGDDAIIDDIEYGYCDEPDFDLDEE
ncbi:unnamed protein product [Colias eurytheme]|nr:unnamed protein product [Colias eurytheme]